MPPEVSVIIPTYNRLHSLPAAIQSVQAQTQADFEILVVDDASTDATEAQVRQIQDPRLCYLRHATNRGAAAARNTGIQAAQGRYLAFLDSDDHWLPEKLAQQVALLESESGVGSCSTQYIVEHEWGQEVLPQSIEPWPQDLTLNIGLGLGTTLMARRECFERVGLFDTSFPRHEDWDWMIRQVQAYPHRLIKQPLAVVERSGVRPRGDLVAQANRRLVEKQHAFLYSFGKTQGRKAEAKRWLETAVIYFQERSFRQGTAYLLRGIALNPLQRAGYYLLIWDAVFGTHLSSHVVRYKASRGRQ